MFQIKKGYLVFKLACLCLFACALVWAVSGANASAQNRSSRAAARAGTPDEPKPEDAPLFSEYKGVQIGMTMEEARKKLGDAQDKSDEQDFYVFNDKESAQVFYDKSRKVFAISVNYVGTGAGAPLPKAVFGSEIEAKPDGSMFKIVRYPKAGYWVSYSRTAGNDPIISVTMQKLN